MRIQQITETRVLDEVTYDDDDKFFEDYGVMYWNDDDDPIDEAEYQGRKVKLGKPMAGDVKKFKVYVNNPKGNVVKVNFGQKGVKIKNQSQDVRALELDITAIIQVQDIRHDIGAALNGNKSQTNTTMKAIQNMGIEV